MQQEKVTLTLTVEVPCYVEKLTQDKVIVSISPQKDKWIIKNIK